MSFIATYRPAVAAFVHDAIKRYPEEACGYITLAGAYVPLRNVHPEPRRHFALAETDAAMMFASGPAAVVHSHPDGPDCPTADDMEGQERSGVPWGIVSTGPAKLLGLEGLHRTSLADLIGTGAIEASDPRVAAALEEIIAYDPFFFGDQLERAPLVGRSFRHGVTDCYEIIRDWWLLERGITLPSFPRSDGWWLEGKDLYRDGFGKAGFVVVDHTQRGFVPQRGDVLLYQLETQIEHNGRMVKVEVPHHAGLFDGPKGVLHHFPKHLSRHFPVSWRAAAITHWLRHAA